MELGSLRYTLYCTPEQGQVQCAPLGQISSLHWDHNDAFSQFTGPHAILPTGYHTILSRLARGIDVEYHSVVKTIEVVDEGVRVGDQQGQSWEADKVPYRPMSVTTSSGHVTAGGCHSASVSSKERKHHFLTTSWRQEVWSN